MKTLLVLPIIIPLSAAAVSLLAWRSRVAQRAIGVIGMAVLFAVAIALMATVWRQGICAVQVGNWPAPYGITIVADTFSAIMVLLASLIGFSVVVYSTASMDPARESFGYYPLLCVLLMGVCGAFLTGDLFNLYVWFEVMLIASFVLLVLGGERAQMEGAIKYVTLNLVSSAILLSAVGIVYGLTGTLNMAHVATRLPEVCAPQDGSPGHGGFVTAVAMMFLVAFGIKSAAFPMFFWLPASYHTPPSAVSAVFAGLLTKVGVYGLIRVFTLLFVHDVGYTHTLIAIMGAVTMVTGVLGAAAQNEFRRILSFHIVSQIGYMIMALGMFTASAITGAIFFLMHNIVAKSSLFLVSGVAYRIRGTYDLSRLSGLYRQYPLLACLFFIPAMALAGIPPLSGFFAKLVIVKAGLEIKEYTLVATALLVGMLTLFSMTKIWAAAFWKDEPEIDNANLHAGAAVSQLQTRIMMIPIIVLALMTIGMGLGAEPILKVFSRAARELMETTEYIRAVMEVRS